MELGLVPGAMIDVLRKAPFGDPVQYRVRGALISMRAAEALVLRCPPSPCRFCDFTGHGFVTGRRIDSILSNSSSTSDGVAAGRPTPTVLCVMLSLETRIPAKAHCSMRWPECVSEPAINPGDVEKKIGRTSWNGRSIELLDLPGNLQSCSAISGRNGHGECSHRLLRRLTTGRCDLYLQRSGSGTQPVPRDTGPGNRPAHCGLPEYVDEVERAGVQIDLEQLSTRLGLPVGHHFSSPTSWPGRAPDAVLREASRDSDMSLVRDRETRAQALLPPQVWQQVEQLSGWLAEHNVTDDLMAPFLVLRSLLDPDGSVEQLFVRRTSPEYQQQLATPELGLHLRGSRSLRLKQKLATRLSLHISPHVFARRAARFSDD